MRVSAGWLGAGLLVVAAVGADAAEKAAPRSCSKSARQAYQACRHEAQSDYLLQLAGCNDLATRKERAACTRAARDQRREALADCADQKEARLDLCDSLGEAAYNPEIDPENFVSEVTNPLFPLKPGTTFIYESTGDEPEHDEVQVTHDTKTILGVVCTVVRDTVSVDGEVTEDTLDWFAQDKDGNVWYFGEHSEEFEDGVLVSLEGSWEAGVDGAKPGIIMEANPKVGDVYRQEFSLGVAEDAAEVLATDAAASVPFGDFTGCLQTHDFTPLEPDGLEHKFYAPGVGLVLELHPETGERNELVDVVHN